MKHSFKKIDIICMLLGLVVLFVFSFSIADVATYGASSHIFVPKVEASAEAVTATGVGQGMDGDILVEVTADQNKIYSVVVLKHDEMLGIGIIAVDQLPGDMVKYNSINVDAVVLPLPWMPSRRACGLRWWRPD